MAIHTAHTRSHFWFIWRVPLLLALLTLFGLLVALLKTGIWHWVAWIALAAPVVIGLWYSYKPRFILLKKTNKEGGKKVKVVR